MGSYNLEDIIKLIDSINSRITKMSDDIDNNKRIVTALSHSKAFGYLNQLAEEAKEAAKTEPHRHH